MIKILKSRKGENIIAVSIIFFITLCCLAVMLNPMSTFIQIGVNSSNSDTGIVLSLLPLFLLLLSIFGFVVSVSKS